jgi:hypothetical protein
MQNGEISFEGVIEVYNASSRANAIRDYEYLYQGPEGDWRPMDSEHYFHGEKLSKDDPPHTVREFNKTPISLAPFSATELNVQSLAKMKPPYELMIKTIVVDLFDKRYSVTVKAEME